MRLLIAAAVAALLLDAFAGENGISLEFSAGKFALGAQVGPGGASLRIKAGE